jgi:hypothetical protein
MKIIKTAALAAMLGVAGIAFAATPDLSVRIVGQTAVAPGAAQKVATIVLTAGPGDVLVQSVPVTASGNVSGCTLRDNTGAALDGYSFAQPLRVPAGATLDLAYTCTVHGGGSATVSVVPGSIVATVNNAAVGVAGVPDASPSATVSFGGSSNTPGVPNTGSTGSTGSSTSGSNSTTTPGVPNTGMGGDAAVTWTLLALSGLVAAAGAIYFARMRNA